MPIVIQHQLTGKRFRYPKFNVNKENYEGFIQSEPTLPREFILSPDQNVTPDMDDWIPTQTDYVATDKDPLDQYSWRDKIW